MDLLVRTHAKVNLFLRVTGVRPDGYHDIETVYHSVSLTDEMKVSATDSGVVEVVMSLDDGLGGEVPAERDNLVWRAAQALIERGAANPGVRLDILKRIPLGAGLAGGSGNAAGALLALNSLWSLGLSRAALLEIGLGLGSDVPFCITGGTALATARGEDLEPVPAPREMWFVLGLDREALPTGDVYRRFDQLERVTEEASSTPLTRALAAGDLEEAGALLHNDLDLAAVSLRPGLTYKKEALLEAGVLGALVCGSGPSIFGLCKDEAHVLSVAPAVADVFDRVAVASSRPASVELESPSNMSP